MRNHEEEIVRLREQLWDSNRECDRLRDRAVAAELLLAGGGSASTVPEDLAASLRLGLGSDQDDSADCLAEKTGIAEVRSRSLGSSIGEAATGQGSSTDFTVRGSSARVAPLGSGRSLDSSAKVSCTAAWTPDVGTVFFRNTGSSVIRSTSAPPLQERRSTSPQVTRPSCPSRLAATNQTQPRHPSVEPAVSVPVKTAPQRAGTFMQSRPTTRATLPVHTAGVYQHKIEKDALLMTVRGLAQQVAQQVAQQKSALPTVVQHTMAAGQQQSSAHQPLTQPVAVGQQPLMQQQRVQQTPQPVPQPVPQQVPVKSQAASQSMPTNSVVQSLAPSVPHLKTTGSPLPTLHPLVISPRNSFKTPCGPAAVGKGLVVKMSDSPTASPNMVQFRFTPDMEMVSAFGNTSAGPLTSCAAAAAAAAATARARRGDTPLSGHTRC